MILAAPILLTLEIVYACIGRTVTAIFYSTDVKPIFLSSFCCCTLLLVVLLMRDVLLLVLRGVLLQQKLY
jgi:hypothetical protein